DFNPAVGEGDEYSLTLALDLESVRDLRQNVPYVLGPPPARIPAYATVTCLCRPLMPDSVRGTFTLATRGLRQITGRHRHVTVASVNVPRTESGISGRH